MPVSFENSLAIHECSLFFLCLNFDRPTWHSWWITWSKISVACSWSSRFASTWFRLRQGAQAFAPDRMNCYWSSHDAFHWCHIRCPTLHHSRSRRPGSQTSNPDLAFQCLWSSESLATPCWSRSSLCSWSLLEWHSTIGFAISPRCLLWSHCSTSQTLSLLCSRLSVVLFCQFACPRFRVRSAWAGRCRTIQIALFLGGRAGCLSSDSQTTLSLPFVQHHQTRAVHRSWSCSLGNVLLEIALNHLLHLSDQLPALDPLLDSSWDKFDHQNLQIWDQRKTWTCPRQSRWRNLQSAEAEIQSSSYYCYSADHYVHLLHL